MVTRHKFLRGEFRPVHPGQEGSETARAKRAGRSLHAQAEHDAKSPDARIRGKGQFALNAQAHKFHPRTGPKKSARYRSRSRA